MIRVFLAGQAVPTWLQKVEPATADAVMAPLVFNEPTVVTVRDGGYRVRSILGTGAPMRIVGARNVTITGQSPAGSVAPVTIDCRPLVSYADVAWLAALLALAVTAR